MQYKTDEEIKEYFRLLKEGNIEYREKIIINYMNLVPYIVVKKLKLERDEDYIEEGYIGLIKAVDTYNYEKNIKFTTYAAVCIQNQIKMFLRKTNKHKNVCSINEIVGESEDGKIVTLEDTLYDEDYDILNDYFSKLTIKENNEKINQIFLMLNIKELKAIKLYYGFDGKPKEQKEIAEILGVSQSYVSRLIRNVPDKVKMVYQIKTLTKQK